MLCQIPRKPLIYKKIARQIQLCKSHKYFKRHLINVVQITTDKLILFLLYRTYGFLHVNNANTLKHCFIK